MEKTYVIKVKVEGTTNFSEIEEKLYNFNNITDVDLLETYDD